MTMAASTRRDLYSANGSTTVFAYTFRIDSSSHLRVAVLETDGSTTESTEGVDYEVDGVGDDGGGNVTFTTAPENGATVILRGVHPRTQAVRFKNRGSFSPDSHELAVDSIVQQVQELTEQMARVPKCPESESTAIGDLPSKTERASGYLGFDSDGDPIAVAAAIDTALVSPFIETLLDDVDAAAARSTLGVTGGGGGSFTWLDDQTGPAPEIVYQSGMRWARFMAGETQKMRGVVTVPSDYTSGQAFLRLKAASPSAANTFLIQAVATLVRVGLDAYDSTTNQRTTTNSALTNTVAKQLREVSLDISDGSSQINGVAIIAGSIILVEVSRGTDTDTADVDVLLDGAEVKFG